MPHKAAEPPPKLAWFTRATRSRPNGRGSEGEALQDRSLTVAALNEGEGLRDRSLTVAALKAKRYGALRLTCVLLALAFADGDAADFAGVVGLQLIVQGAKAQAEEFGGALLVVAGVLQGQAHVGLFDIAHLHADGHVEDVVRNRD